MSNERNGGEEPTRRDYLQYAGALGVGAHLAGGTGQGDTQATETDATDTSVDSGDATTADAIRESGVPVDVVPDEYRAEGLIEALSEAAHLDGARVLLARAEEARDLLPRELGEAGARVDEVTAYRTEVANPEAGDLAARLRAGEIDWVTFTAPSTVRNFVRLVGRERGSARVAAIGPITADAAEEAGLAADVVAEEYTIPGLVRALAEAETARAGG